MEVKSEKSRSISIVKGVSSKLFYMDEEANPTVLEKSVKMLGRWYDAALIWSRFRG